MLDRYTTMIKDLKRLTVMRNTLEIMKQKKNELVNPQHEKTNSLQSNISYFLNIIAQN